MTEWTRPSRLSPLDRAIRCSIVIPAYNAAAFLAEAIASAVAQGDDVEVIVVDDGSTDGTAAVAEAAGGVRLIRQDNAGRSAARNAGFARTRAPYVVFLDADDRLAPGAVAAHLAAMAKHPDAAMVFGSNDRIDAAGRRLDINRQSPFETADPAEVALRVTPSPTQCLYRRDAVAAEGGFDPALGLCEDPDLNLRLLSQGRIVCHETIVASYRLHAGQSTKRPSRIACAHLGVIRRHLGPGGRFADAAALARCARKWKRYYGRNMPAEIARTMLRRDWTAAGRAGRTFLECLPQSAMGAAVNLPGLLQRRFGSDRRSTP